ncbi:MAG: 2-C-methyl-D-erythritol 2,4-cyclodiphosphate synthase [Candidatus Moranbacteria bacterium]|nr:2-C-methyl-D-erythritol 2,4-cyclodiphosphate synthase [Candidatus Moranbacteria bacterium]
MPRENLWHIQTPQIASKQTFLECHQKAIKEKFVGTDNMSLLENTGVNVSVSPGSYDNLKVTTPEDLIIFQTLIKKNTRHTLQLVRTPTVSAKQKKGLILGGLVFSDEIILDGESDGDAVLHALCNTLGSACGTGSLGVYATEMNQQGINDSTRYVKHVKDIFRKKNITINNVSISIEAKRPKLEKSFVQIKKISH